MNRYVFGPYCLDERQRRLMHGDRELAMGRTAFDLLLLLVRNPGTVFRREELLDRVWPAGADISDGALSQTILTIRRALGEDGREMLRTVARSGYAFEGVVQLLPSLPVLESAPAPGDADVTVHSQPVSAPAQGGPVSCQDEDADRAGIADPSDGSGDAPAAGETPNPSAPTLFPEKRSRRWWLAGFLAFAFVIIAMAMMHRSQSPPPRIDRLVIDVPEAAASAAGAVWLADALASILETELRGRQGLRVRSAHDARAQVVPDGTAHLSGVYRLMDTDVGRIRIDWKLELPGREPQAWTQVLEPDAMMSLVPDMHAALSTRVAGITLEPRRMRMSSEAMTAYSQGKLARHRHRPREARAALEAALVAAPDLVMARYELAQVLAHLGYRDLAVSHARRALKDARKPEHADIAPVIQAGLYQLLREHDSAAKAYGALAERDPGEPRWRLLQVHALVDAGNPIAARSHLERVQASGLNPRERVQVYLAANAVAVAQGRLQDSLAEARAALSLAQARSYEDLSADALMAMVLPSYRLHDYAAAMKAARTARGLYRRLGDVDGEFRAYYAQLAGADLGSEMPAEADYVELRALAERMGNAHYLSQAGFASAAYAESTGSYGEALAGFRSVLRLLSRGGSEEGRQIVATRVVSLLLLVGRIDEAAALLDTIPGKGQPQLVDEIELLKQHLYVASARGELPAAAQAARRVIAAEQKASPDTASTAYCNLLFLLIEAGRFDAAVKTMPDCERAVRDRPDGETFWDAAVLAYAPRLLSHQRRAEDAENAMVQAETLGRQLPKMQWSQLVGGIMLARLQIGPPARARAEILRLQSDLGTALSGRSAASAEVLLGLAELGAGDNAAARASLARARLAAPSDEGRLGMTMELLSLALRPVPDSDLVQSWLRRAERNADDTLLVLATHAFDGRPAQAMVIQARRRMLEQPGQDEKAGISTVSRPASHDTAAAEKRRAP